MKRIIGISVLCLFVMVTVFAQSEETAIMKLEANSTLSKPVMAFDSTEINYGVIQQNSDPYREFHFKNTGETPLVISHAKGSCGCTVPEWSKEPVGPGEEGVIKVRYATNRLGKFTKTVTLTTNDTEGKHVLTIKGEVLKPETLPNQGETQDKTSNDN